jgi:hypothetical protein
MRILYYITIVYCVGLAALVQIPVSPEVPSLPAKNRSKSQGDSPARRILEVAHKRMEGRPGIHFADFLGRDKRVRFNYRRVRKAYDALTDTLARAQASGERPSREKVMRQFQELKNAGGYLEGAIDHQRDWIGKVRVQLGLAFGLGLVAALFGLIGLHLVSAIGLLLGALAPLLYGILVQPFPGEPLALSGPLLIAAVIAFVFFLKRRKGAPPPAPDASGPSPEARPPEAPPPAARPPAA